MKNPELIALIVFLPTTMFDFLNFTLGIKDAFFDKFSNDRFIPGAITPPL